LFKQTAHRAAHSDPKLKPFFERISRKKGNQESNRPTQSQERKLLVSKRVFRLIKERMSFITVIEQISENESLRDCTKELTMVFMREEKLPRLVSELWKDVLHSRTMIHEDERSV
jgi:hypothetical protein